MQCIIIDICVGIYKNWKSLFMFNFNLRRLSLNFITYLLDDLGWCFSKSERALNLKKIWKNSDIIILC